MTKRVLFVSIAFPPKADPECIQTGRYFINLTKDQEFIFDVVTSASPTVFMPIDYTLQKYNNVSGQLLEVPLYESKYLNFIIRLLFPVQLSKPDSKMTFHWQWRKVIKKLRNKPDLVYSRSYPLSSAVMGYKLANHFGVPWILHLSDPWTENVLHHYSKTALVYHDRMERKCFERATVICFTSELTKKLYVKKYPAWETKMEIFPNVYDADWQVPATSTNRKDDKKIRLVYTGGLANTRTASSLIDSLRIMLKKYPGIESKLEVIFAGDMDRANRSLFENNKAMSFVNHVGLISAEKAFELQYSANLLIVIDSEIKDKNKAVFFPSKLLDYALMKKPILSVTSEESVTHGFVNLHGGVCFEHTKVNEMADWIAKFVNGHITMEPKNINIEYSAAHQANRLVTIMRSIV